MNAKQDIKFNCEIQYYDNIPLRLIARKDYDRKNAKRFVINETNQNIWIPNKHLLENGTIRKNANLDYLFMIAERQNKLVYAGIKWKREC